MAQTAWVAMTRATAGRQSSKTARTRVDAGVKELNEMTIGRTDDPENPFVAQAFKAASVFGLGSRTPSGPAAVLPRQQAEHMIAIDPPVRILIFSLASEGPSTHAARSPVNPNRERKPSGSETTFANDLVDVAAIEASMLAVAHNVWDWCEKTGERGRTVTVKVKWADFRHVPAAARYPRRCLTVRHCTSAAWR